MTIQPTPAELEAATELVELIRETPGWPLPSAEAIAAVIAAHRAPADPAQAHAAEMETLCTKLVSYRLRVGANFQLEKADDFIGLMRNLLATLEHERKTVMP